MAGRYVNGEAPRTTSRCRISFEVGGRKSLESAWITPAADVLFTEACGRPTGPEMLTFLGIALLYSCLGAGPHTCFQSCLRPCTGSTRVAQGPPWTYNT